MNSQLNPYLRIVVNHSDECNLRCAWCHKEGLSFDEKGKTLSASEIGNYSFLFWKIGTRKFKIVGGEPTLRDDLCEIIRAVRNISDDIDLSMVTNGTRLAETVREYKKAGLHRINVSLFTMNRRYFKENIGPGAIYDSVLEGIDTAITLGLCHKINHIFHDMDDLTDVLSFARVRNLRVNILNTIPSIDMADGMPSDAIWKMIQKLPIRNTRIENDPYSLPVKVISLSDGTEIEFKHCEIGRLDLFNSCLDCQTKERCHEGIFALRLTPSGKIQPCIVRDDNSFDLKSHPNVESLQKYLGAL